MYDASNNHIWFNGASAEQMRIDSSGRVGIGTSSPVAKLVVADAGGHSFEFVPNNTANTNWLQNYNRITSAYTNIVYNALTHQFKNSGADVLTITSSNNVGIGNTAPAALLHVGSLNGTGSLNGYTKMVVEGTDYAVVTLKCPSANFNQIIFTDTTTTSLGGINYFNSTNATPNAMAFLTAGSERMRIDNSGNVGIGTSSPGAKLEVAGSVSVTGTNTINGSSCIMTIGDSTRTASSSTTTGAIVCGGGLGVWSTINAGGEGNFASNVSVFSTNPSSTQQGILLRNTFNVGPSIFSMGVATSNGIITFVGGNGEQGAINGNGSGINYVTTSDYRLKENVAPMTGALAKISQLKPCTYTWKFDGSDGQGFIAHELQEVFPDAVSGKKDDVEIYTDEDGNEQTRIKPQGVDTGFLVATLTAAIQEQQALIASLTARIVALEST
jgi:hypothetical protein